MTSVFQSCPISQIKTSKRLVLRRSVMREIANLGKTADLAPSAPSRPAPPTAPTATSPAEAAGERRHVTVMFCDLVDSTSIATRLDAEEWRDVVGAYLDAASAAVIPPSRLNGCSTAQG
jgi:class 3 adenylate cyclase